MISWLKPTSLQTAAVRIRRIGVDVGTRALKLVPIEKMGHGWTVGHPLLIPYPGQPPATNRDIAQGLLRQILQEELPPSVRSANLSAGCVFSMSLSALQTLELPPGTEAEQRQMAEADLAESPPWLQEEQVFDTWPETVLSSKENGATIVNVLSVPNRTAATLAQDLLPFGMLCDSIDGSPFAMARAVSMSRDAGSNFVAALDWGASGATFVLCQNGRPAFTRRFRECGFWRSVEHIQQLLGLPPKESSRLLEAIGMPPRDVCPASRVARLVSSAAAGSIRLIAEEIFRTLRFLKTDAGIEPEQLILLGGGACLRHADLRLTELTGIPTRPWRFPGRTPSAVPGKDALFGIAFATGWGADS